MVFSLLLRICVLLYFFSLQTTDIENFDRKKIASQEFHAEEKKSLSNKKLSLSNILAARISEQKDINTKPATVDTITTTEQTNFE